MECLNGACSFEVPIGTLTLQHDFGQSRSSYSGVVPCTPCGLFNVIHIHFCLNERYCFNVWNKWTGIFIHDGPYNIISGARMTIKVRFDLWSRLCLILISVALMTVFWFYNDVFCFDMWNESQEERNSWFDCLREFILFNRKKDLFPENYRKKTLLQIPRKFILSTGNICGTYC